MRIINYYPPHYLAIQANFFGHLACSLSCSYLGILFPCSFEFYVDLLVYFPICVAMSIGLGGQIMIHPLNHFN
jgi:hypothetical protein